MSFAPAAKSRTGNHGDPFLPQQALTELLAAQTGAPDGREHIESTLGLEAAVENVNLMDSLYTLTYYSRDGE